MMQFFKKTLSKKGQSTLLWDEPELAPYNDKDVIREFNKNLQNDSEFVIPDVIINKLI